MSDDDPRCPAGRQQAFDRLERASRGPSVVTADEERRMYELNRQGVDAPITPRAPMVACPSYRRHKPHDWTTGAGAKRYCGGRP